MHPDPSSKKRIVRARPGSVYVAVLGAGIICTVAGLSAVTLTRVQNKVVTDTRGVAAARLAAQSAVEVGVYRIFNDLLWRSSVFDDQWAATEEVGPYRLTFKHVDEMDGVVSGNPEDPVRVYCAATVGDAVRVHSILLETDTAESEAAIGSALHAGGNIKIGGGANLSAVGGVVSTNAKLINGGRIEADVRAMVITAVGDVEGSVKQIVIPKEMPDESAFAPLIAAATQLPFNGDIARHVIAPNYNDYGAGVNPDGLYYIDTMEEDIGIRKSRIQGTLIINTRGGTVTISKQVLLHGWRADYPTLIVIGNTRFRFTTQGDDNERNLDEMMWSRNFNPIPAPYEGISDKDVADMYPSEIQGFVHVIGDLELCKTSRVRGGIVCSGDVTIEDSPEVIGDPDILASPPSGYEPLNIPAMNTRMRIVPGSLRRDVGSVATEVGEVAMSGYQTPGP